MSEEGLLAPPRGMRDFYPEDLCVRDAIFDAWRKAARLHGFLPYDACVVESLALLKRKAGEEIVNQIYHFTDKSGRELALRPEMTPTLARMVAARQGALIFPIKWHTIAQCFRYERMTRGRKREHYQWNLDIIGDPSPAAEVEILGAAARALACLGLGPEDLRIHFNSRRLLGELLAGLAIAPEHHTAAFIALDKLGKAPEAEIAALMSAAGLPADVIARVFELMTVRSLDDAAARLGTESPGLAEARRFLALADTAGLSPLLHFDIAVIRGLSYYTGIVFEGFDAQRRFRAIFGGGRYDNLLRDVGGEPMTGVGLGFGDVVVAELLQDLGRTANLAHRFDFAIGYMEEAQRGAAMAVANGQRCAGRAVDLALGPQKPKAFFARAGRSGATEAIFIGPDDLARGSVRIKNLATRDEREAPLSALA